MIYANIKFITFDIYNDQRYTFIDDNNGGNVATGMRFDLQTQFKVSTTWTTYM